MSLLSVAAVAAADQSIGELMVFVSLWTVAFGFIVLAVTVCVPPLWSEGLSWMREVLSEPRVEVVDCEERRRSLRRAMGGR